MKRVLGALGDFVAGLLLGLAFLFVLLGMMHVVRDLQGERARGAKLHLPTVTFTLRGSPCDGSDLGCTYCEGDNTPVAFLNETVWDGPLEPFVKLHERTHIAQIKRFPSCAAWYPYYSEHRAELEAEAFAAMVKAGFPMITAARWLSNGYPDLKLSVGDAYALIWTVGWKQSR